ncbi:hypothetical protein GE09DRAFT_1224149 [Coniochaeta sp. 2T2.1]|nr:hypothetical protein GE09DRAFT_1224149 [Coniochaeta sp. 2T2.1]
MSTTPRMAQGPKPARLDISTLISPPEAVYDSFSSSAMARILPTKPLDSKLSTQQGVPPSPPISNQSDSPLEQVKHDFSPTPSLSVSVKDPILYPAEETTASSSGSQLLFCPVERDALGMVIQSHRLAKGASSATPQPTDEEYREVLYFKSNVMKHFQANRKGWLQRERALLAADRKARPSTQHHIKPAFKPRNVQPQPAKQQHIRSNNDRVQSTKGNEPRVTKSQATPRHAQTNPETKRSAKRMSSTPDPGRSHLKPVSKEDKDFNSLPDFSPPLSSLGNRSLKVEWKGGLMDLTNDPNRHLLLPEELKLASLLRLDCATYLTSKRRIFISRRDCLMRTPPKAFRKTDAQQACKIDVNKASKLWTAFDNVGWLDERWVKV